MFEESCNRCGYCCRHVGYPGIPVSDNDLERWEAEGRKDIIREVTEFDGGKYQGRYIPASMGYHVSNCLFIDSDSHDCEIQETKPDFCSNYPLKSNGESLDVPEGICSITEKDIEEARKLMMSQ